MTGGPDLTLFEVNQAAAIIKESAHPDVNMIFGAVIDPNMGDRLRITVIATGFDHTGMPRRLVEKRPRRQESRGTAADAPAFAPQTIQTDDLDIPSFLRHRHG